MPPGPVPLSFPLLWLWLPAIFFGLYFASFIHCVRWLLFEDEGWRIRKKITWWLATTTLLVFFLSTALFCSVVMTPLPPADAIMELYISVLETLDSSAIQWSNIILIDSVMIYRCWIVFSKNWFIICFPMALWCFCLACAILSFYCYLVTSFDVTVPDPEVCSTSQSNIMSWMPVIFYVGNITINIYTTSALVYTIWRAAKSKAGTNQLYRICRILTESGILYTLSSLIYLITWMPSTSNSSDLGTVPYMDPAMLLLTAPLGFRIVLGVVMFIPGIAFNLVIIRIGEQRVNGEDTWADSRNATNALVPSELLNHADMSVQGEMVQDDHERMDEGGAMEINETEIGEIMEVARDRTRELKVQS